MRQGFRFSAFADAGSSISGRAYFHPDLGLQFGEATDGDDRLVIVFGNAVGLMGNDILIGLGGDNWSSGDFESFVADSAVGDVRFGDDLLLGGDKHDVLYGDLFDLKLTSNGSDDVTVTFGADVLFSQDGNDQEWSQSVYGDSYVSAIDLSAAGTSNVTVLAGDDVVANGGVYERNSNSVMSTGDTYRVEIILGAGTGTARFDGGDDIVVGGDRLYGDGLEAIVTVQDDAQGRAVITGGDDVLIGQEGTFWINGDFFVYRDEGQFIGGNDTLVSGEGDNILTGDYAFFSTRYGFLDKSGLGVMPDDVDFTAGADLFVFKDVFGDDVIVDFNPGLDRLVFDRDCAEFCA